MKIDRNRALIAAAVLAALGTSSSHSSAANVYWDINGTTPGSGATAGVASGTWDGTATLWNDDAAGGSGNLSADIGAANTGVFSAASDATGVSSVFIPGGTTRTIGGLELKDGNVNIVPSGAGSGILSMPNAATTIDVPTAGATLAIGINANPIIIDSSGTITKSGAGILFINGVNNAAASPHFTGKWIVNGGLLSGVLNGNNSNQLGVNPTSFVGDIITLDGGGLRTTNTSSAAFGANRGITIGAGGGTFDLSAAGSVSFNGKITGTAGITVTGIGIGFAFPDNSATYSGKWTLKGGEINPNVLNSDKGFGAIPLNDSSDAVTLDGGAIRGSASLVISATRGITLGAGGGKLHQVTGGTMTVGSVISGTAGSGTLTLLLDSGTGTSIVLGAANTYTSPTVVSGTAGVASVSGSLASTNVTVNSGATLNVSGSLASNTALTAAGNVNFTSAAQTLASLSGGGSVALNGPTALTVGSGSFVGAITGAGGSLLKNTGLTLTLSGTNTYGGNTIISGGTLSVSAPANLGSGNGVNMDGGTLLTTAGLNNPTRNISVNATGGTIDSGGFDSTFGVLNNGAGTITKTGAGTLTITRHAGGGVLNITGGAVAVTPTGGLAAGTSKVDSVSISGGGRFDIGDNKIVATAQAVGSWNGSAYTDMTGLVASGYSVNQDFSGSGVVTSQSNATAGNSLTNIGVASNTDLGLATFGGVSVGANDTLVMYTYGGDANLDGIINGDDYFQIDSATASSHGWFNGDFNYDGVINGDDYFVIDSNFAAQGAAIPTGVGVGAVAAVPEPMSIALVAISATALLARRRRVR